MKGIVVYYSATGNTRKIARAIGRGMNEVMECHVAAITEVGPQAVADYDVIGIGGPIWYYREPANLRIFINGLPDLKGKMCFPFAVHGSSPSGFMFSIVPPLKRKGLTVIGYNDWYGSVYQVLHMPKPYLTDGHPDDIDLREAEEFGREMAGRAARIAAGEKGLIPELPKGPEADPLWAPPRPPRLSEEQMKKVPPMPKTERSINTEKCLYPECTICADNCPVKSIDLSASPPVIRKNCINDYLCERLCPVSAIELDAASRQRVPVRRINTEKCRYPECTLCADHCPMGSIDLTADPPAFKGNCEGDDLCWVICPEGAVEIVNMEDTHGAMLMKDASHPFVGLLAEAEAKGRFRRLVPLEKVGWNTPILSDKRRPVFRIEEA